MDDDEQTFSGSLLGRIDRAFDAAKGVKSTHGIFSGNIIAPPTVRRRRGDPALSQPASTSAGGFLAPSPPAGGGFLLEDEDEPPQSPADSSSMQPTEADIIPLPLIPSALQILDLPPADDEIMEIFCNAAGSTGGSGVTRDDFRAVCQILLSNEDDNGNDEEEDEELLRDSQQENGNTRKLRARQPPPSSEMDEDIEERELTYEDDSEEDSYVKESSSNEEEYTPSRGKQTAATKGKAPVRPTGATSARKRKRVSSPQDEEVSTLTRRQRAVCREAFGLFFPDVDDRDLDSQTITIRDISRVSEVLRIKLTADEVLGMLQEFSTSPDKSISLSDFENIMMVARLA